MAKNLRQQLLHIMYICMCIGRSKHADKRKHNTAGRIYSFCTRNAYIEVINIFAHWMRTHYPQIRRPQDIRPEHIYMFLLEKAKTSTQATVDTYRSILASLGTCIRITKHLKGYDLHVPYVRAARKSSQARGAQAAITRTDYDKILAYCLQHPSGSAYALLLENHLAGRVTDVCERMRVQDGYMSMKCKGGKILRRRITPELVALLEDPRFAQWRTSDGKFLLPKANTIANYLRNLQLRLGIEHHSFHSIRRLLAQEHYDSLRRNGMDRNQALGEVCLWLNHGPRRQALVRKSYVANPW